MDVLAVALTIFEGYSSLFLRYLKFWQGLQAIQQHYNNKVFKFAEYRLILSRRGRIPSWLDHAIFRKIEQDNGFIIQLIDNKT
jgi:hypothetical protein